ncbi:MAG: hypothetical protein J6K48_05210 [Lachnospiraceae bacterium]|nr:hypothetical protein [Lachnospiraceae bacterium]
MRLLDVGCGEGHLAEISNVSVDYHDWKIELLEEVIFDCDSSGVPHQHCMDVVIAGKYG